MKVLWFTNTAAGAGEYLNLNSFGGGWLDGLSSSLKDNVDLHIAFYHNQDIPEFTFKGITYHPIDMKLSKIKIIKNIFFPHVKDEDDLKQYLKIIDRVNPDLIHIHGTENPFGCIVHHTSLPVVFSIQGIISSILDKYYSGIDKAYGKFKNKGSLKELILQNNFNKAHRFLRTQKVIEQKNLLRAKYIIGRTKWDERVTRVLAPKSQYFHNDEILRNKFYEHEWQPGFDGQCLKIYSTNGNSIYKGFETICKTLYLLQQYGINVEWRVAGIKPSDTIVSIVKKMLGNEFPDSGLVFLGPINDEEIIRNLKNADVYVMPSHIENSPNNLCEAMILGLPCIATCAGGTGSILENGEEGILIQDGDAYSMAGSVLELYHNFNIAIQMGADARKKALKRHEKTKIINDLLKIYHNILAIKSSDFERR